jgi:hypothetical protein
LRWRLCFAEPAKTRCELWLNIRRDCFAAVAGFISYKACTQKTDIRKLRGK